MEREIYMVLSWQNMDKAMRCGEMEYVAEAILRIRSGMPTGYYLHGAVPGNRPTGPLPAPSPLHTAKMVSRSDRSGHGMTSDDDRRGMPEFLPLSRPEWPPAPFQAHFPPYRFQALYGPIDR